MIAPARIAAYDILVSLAAGRADLPTLIAHARLSLADERDRALAAEIATGVQRWRAALDHLIVAFAKRPIDRLDHEIVEILRLSAYQILHLTRVPASAVVDDAVNLAKRAGKTSASGFVNAILRTTSRRRAALPLPPRPADPGDRTAALDYFAITLSHPRWLAARWLDRYGFDATERWLQFNNEAAPLTLRVNPLRGTREQLLDRLAAEDVAVTPGRFAPDALLVADGHPLRTTMADEGWFVVQDEASQIVPLLAGPRPGPAILDPCASPGGKTTALAAAAGPEARIVACDVRDRRMDLLRRIVGASGATTVRLVQADLLSPLPFTRPFDLVIVDAPCSGLGTLRRDPDIKWRRRETELATLAAAQATMLGHAAAMVAPGGRLVYSTCSSEPEENDAVVDAFLRRPEGPVGPEGPGGAEGPGGPEGPHYQAIDLAAEGLVPRELIDDRGRLRTLPHVHGLEAFFGAAFQRRR